MPTRTTVTTLVLLTVSAIWMHGTARTSQFISEVTLALSPQLALVSLLQIPTPKAPPRVMPESPENTWTRIKYLGGAYDLLPVTTITWKNTLSVSSKIIRLKLNNGQQIEIQSDQVRTIHYSDEKWTNDVKILTLGPVLGSILKSRDHFVSIAYALPGGRMSNFLLQMDKDNVTDILTALSRSTGLTIMKGAVECGPPKQRYHVKIRGDQHPTPPPSPGKSMVYFLRNDYRWPFENTGLEVMYALDGKWAGATRKNGYFYAERDPGLLKVCVIDLSGHPALLYMTTEADKTYYVFSGSLPESFAIQLSQDQGGKLLTRLQFCTFEFRK